MTVVAVGTNHKFSPIELREKISFSRKSLGEALLSLKESPLLEGAVILSTCNRVELYASAEDSGAGIEELQRFLSRFHKMERERLLPFLYIYEGKEAIKHLFLVASGLDSLILGETQILGQVKSAFFQSKNHGFTDEYLETIFSAAITFAKEVHQKTRISRGKISIGSVAIDFIKEKLGGLSGKKILIIGAGKVTELVLEYLREERPEVIFISTRTFEKAKELASRIGQKAAQFDEFPRLLKHADVIISATKSPHFIIKKETLGNAVSGKLLIMDLAMPRDVDPRVREIENIDLFNIEDLSSIVRKNLERKNFEAEKIRWLIQEEVEKLTALEPEPALLP